jgi:hypothetical protein
MHRTLVNRVAWQGQLPEIKLDRDHPACNSPNREFKNCRHFATVAEPSHLAGKP